MKKEQNPREVFKSINNEWINSGLTITQPTNNILVWNVNYIKWLEEKYNSNDWISVDDYLPDTENRECLSDDYLVVVKFSTGSRQMVAEWYDFIDGYEFSVDINDGSLIYEITHWKHLDELP